MRLPVTLHLKPSRRLAAALAVAHAAVAGGLAATALTLAAKILVVAALALSLAFALRRHVLRPRFAALTLLADGHIEAALADGGTTTLRVLPDTTVLPWLMVLRLRGGDLRVALALPPDAVEAGGHRELRLWLRWKAANAPTA